MGPSTELLPPIHVHSLVTKLNFHTSLSSPPQLSAAKPPPSESQRAPFLSVQTTASARLPGVFAEAETPNVPNVPVWLALLLPPSHIHWPVCAEVDRGRQASRMSTAGRKRWKMSAAAPRCPRTRPPGFEVSVIEFLIAQRPRAPRWGRWMLEKIGGGLRQNDSTLTS